MYAKVDIDHSKCTTPFDCKKCIQICPQAIFDLLFVKLERQKEIDRKEPGAVRMRVIYRDKCTGCNDCVKVCPVNAIKISYPEVVKK